MGVVVDSAAAVAAAGPAVVVDSAEEAPVTAGNSVIPLWLRRYLKFGDRDIISHAVKQAESKTSGEIIPMVVRQSMPTGHVPLFIALVIFSALLIFDLESHLSDWGQGFTYALPLFIFISYLVGHVLAKIPAIRRLFLNKQDMTQAVHERAELEFYRGRFDQTAGHTGVLIFVSIFERRVVVLADKSISAKLQPQIWDDVVALIIKELKNKDLTTGLIKAIKVCGDILAKEFPASAHNANEISNQLVIKD
jgi:putative membrane protein